MGIVVIIIGILILLPLVVWVQRLQARGAITDQRLLDRLIRERITGRPAPLYPPDYRKSRLRYYRTVFGIVPASTAGVAALIAAAAKPHDALGLVMSPAFMSGMIVLAISEDRFAGVSRRQRITCASFSGLLAAVVAVLLISALDPNATLAGASH